MVVGVERHALVALLSGKRPGTQWKIRGIIKDFTPSNFKRTLQLWQDCSTSNSPKLGNQTINQSNNQCRNTIFFMKGF